MNSTRDILSFFESEVSAMTIQTQKSYTKAVNSFGRALHTETDIGLSENLVTEWISHLIQQGYSYKVATYYLKIISSLYNKGVKARKLCKSDIFANVRSRLELIAEMDFDISKRENDYSRLLLMAKNAARSTKDTAIITDLLLICILSDIKNPATVGMLKKDDSVIIDKSLSEKLERNISPHRKYIFGLNQSQLSPRQFVRTLDEAISGLLALKGFTHRLPVNDTIENLWAFAALKSGISPSRIVGCLGHRPADNPLFALCSAESLSDDEKSSIHSAVAKTILVNPKEWFVMRLRPGVRYETIKQSIASMPADKPQLFYPCDEIRKRVNRKLVYEQRPVIPDIVFFKTKMTDVRPLFRLIGDKAWCYTTDTRSGNYAIIPKKAMETFQQAIGKFSDDYEVGPIGSLALKKGDRISIIGGLFSGNQGIIDRIEESDNNCNTIYRVIFPDENGFEWRVKIDARLVKHSGS